MSRRKTSGAGLEGDSNTARLDLKQIERGVELILRGIGVDLADSNFVATPQRVARMYKEMLTPPKNTWTDFPSPTSGMIVLRGHHVFAICPHHLQVVELRAYVAYIPRTKVLGLSKLARAVESHLTKPIMQEELGDLVADALYEKVDAQGVAVTLAGVHGCLRARGIQTTGDVVTETLRGLFLHSQAARDEYLRIIGTP